MNPRLEAPGYVRWIARTLEGAGYETWAVGGAIRNALLGVASGDWDMATRAQPSVVRRLFPRTVPIGVEHGTVGVLSREGVLVEVTTFRRDVETSGRHAVVEFAETLLEDLARRDFTINAVAWHPLREEFRDPFEGRKDLEDRLLRTVGRPEDRFAEDYLRVLRGIRFSGRFGLRIHPDTWKALCTATAHLGILSPERVREEFLKILSEDEHPARALELYAASGVLEALYPELAAVRGHQRPGREEDLFEHSLQLADGLPRHRPVLRLAAVLHGLGVPGPPPASPEERGRERAAALMIRSRYSNAETQRVTELLRMGLEPPLNLSTPADLRRWLQEAGPASLPDFARIWIVKARLDRTRWGTEPGDVLNLIRRLRGQLQSHPPLDVGDLALTGRDLIAFGLKPGPEFGVILDRLLLRVLDDPEVNTRDRLLEILVADGVLEDETG